MLFRSREHENAGIRGWWNTWIRPRAVIKKFEALPPSADDRESLLVRAYATSNVVHAYNHLGHFAEAIATYEESARRWEAQGVDRATVGTEAIAVAIAALASGVDMRDSAAASDARRFSHAASRWSWPLDPVVQAIVLNAPSDRHEALARAARQSCHGRYPDEESTYLAALAVCALSDDPARASWLVDSVTARTTGDPVLARLVRLHASGEPLDLLASEHHYFTDLARLLVTRSPRERFAINRPKLDAEVARILD